MSALEIAQNTLAAPVTVPKEFLTALAEKYSGTDFDVDELMKDPELMKFAKKAKGRRTVTKKTPPAEERRGEYESHKCDARIWLAVRGMKNTGYSDIQCSSKKVDGCLCRNMRSSSRRIICGVDSSRRILLKILSLLLALANRRTWSGSMRKRKGESVPRVVV